MRRIAHRAKSPRRSDDSGSALVLALMVVTVTGVVMAAVLQFTGTGLTLAPKLRNDRNETNFLQGSVDGAINSIRGSSVDGTTTSPDTCPTYTPAVPSGVSGVEGKAFVVTCEAKDPGSLPGGPDVPAFAIHTLGVSPEGLRQSGGNDLLTVSGGVYSHGVVSVTAGVGNERNRMDVVGSVYADGSCTPLARITTSDSDRRPRCDRTTDPTGTVFGADPKYKAAIAGPTDVDDPTDLADLIAEGAAADRGADPKPTCAGGVTTFYPGYYSVSPRVLRENLASTCSGANIWNFQKGRYYFDFDDPWQLGNPGGVTVIAGETTRTTVGTACDTNNDEIQDVEGVQFVFGGRSQILVGSGGAIEVCGPMATQAFRGAPQRISMFGIANGITDPVEGDSTLLATATPVPGGDAIVLAPGAATTIDGLSSTNLTLPKGDEASLQYNVFEDLPRGARVSAVAVEVAHELGEGTSATVALTTPSQPVAGNAQTFDVIGSSCDRSAPCRVEIPLNSISKAPAWRDLKDIKIKYTARRPSGSGGPGSVQVDGVRLYVEYTLPTIRDLDCGSTTCQFFNSTVNLNVFVHGTVYTPGASWSVQVQNDSGTIFDRGVVMRNLDVNVSASSTQTKSPFQLPAATPNGRLVLFRGSVDSVEKVRACVRYIDKVSLGARTVGLPGYGVAIPHWAVLRTPTSQDPSCA